MRWALVFLVLWMVAGSQAAVAVEDPAKLFKSTSESIAKGKTATAYRMLRRALSIARKRGDKALELELLLRMADVRIAVTDLDRAATVLGQVLVAARASGNKILEAKALTRLASVDLRQARLDRAAARLASVDSLAVVLDRPTANLVDLNRSILFGARGDLAAAERSLDRIERRASGNPTPPLDFALRSERAHILLRRSDYKAALEAWQSALALAREQGLRGAEGVALINIAEIMLAFGMIDDAFKNLKVAQDISHEVNNRHGEMKALRLLSQASKRLQRLPLAETQAAQALELARRGRDYLAEGRVLVQLAELRKTSQIAKAESALRDAINLFARGGYQHEEFDARIRLAALHAGGGNRRKSGPLIRILTRAVIDPARKAGNDDILWRALYLQAKYSMGRNDLKTAIGLFEEAIAALERIYERTTGLDRTLRAAFLAERRTLYEDYVRILIEVDPKTFGGNPKQRAFEISEMSRSRQFSEMVLAASAERKAARDNEILKKLIDRSREVRLNLTLQRQRLRGLPSRSGERRAVRAEIAELQAELKTIGATIDRDHPAYRDLIRPKPLTIRQVQKMLRKDEAVISYFMTKYRLVSFIFTPTAFHVVPIRARKKSLQEAIHKFRKPLAFVRRLADLEAWNPRLAHELYATIVKPLESFLSPSLTLFVAPDGMLNTLPFEALLSAAPKKTPKSKSAKPKFHDFASLPWLGDRYIFAYIPSVGALKSLRDGGLDRNRWTTNLVAFADPDFGGGQEAAGSELSTKGLIGNILARATGVSRLGRLPETADEARAVRRIVGGNAKIFLRRDASESRVYSLNLENTRYLMFSTHGLLGGDFSGLAEPALALSLVGNPQGTDGFLTMGEVLGLRLNTDLTVLSACNTAGKPGEAEGGEGFAGLTRSFMYAGTRSLLVSHWPVASRATVDLITFYFEELASGSDKAKALQRAKARLRKQSLAGVSLAHPLFWAPFVVVGER